MSQVRTTAATAAAELGHTANELPGFLAFGDHRFAERGHQDQLAQIAWIGQPPQHNSRTITELISQALRSALQPAAINPIEARHQQLMLANRLGLSRQGCGFGNS